MKMITGNTYLADIQIKSPMGWVKVEATLTLTSETDFSGSARLLGFTVALTDCSRSGSHFRFAAAPKLPFGVLQVSIEADIDETGADQGPADSRGLIP